MTIYPNLGANVHIVTATVPDVSTPGSTGFVAPGIGRLIKMACVIDGPITSDATLTVSSGGVEFGTIVIPSAGSGAGTVAFGTVTAPRHTFTDTSHIKVETDGASTGAAKASVTFHVSL